ncbi:MAG: 4Fe-4S dicluster domain-containing protein [Leptospiraceae bacterium]|nr:4Fe-4S dicluster domain-containing protein [Leptospiraceae bacterium]
MDRKKFFKHGFKKILGAVKEAKEIKEEIPGAISKIVKSKTKNEEHEKTIELPPPPEEMKPKRNTRFKNLNFPPGAIEGKGNFEKTCTGCGDCIAACPYNTIFPVYDPKYGKSLPFMDLNLTACMMCKDYPCIKSCNHKALKKIPKSRKPIFGQAKATYKFCLNSQYEEQVCEKCKEACPINNVIKITNGKPGFSDKCTGCGICVASCPTFPKAIVIK